MTEPASLADGWVSSPPVFSRQVHRVSVRIHAAHPEIRARVEQFLTPLVGGEEQLPSEILDLFLGFRPDDEATPSVPSSVLVQYLHVSCFQDGPTLSFQTQDGSVLRADIELGRAWGALSREFAVKRSAFTDLQLAPIMEMLRHRGYYGLHAAAVARDGTGYLFPGSAGAGKTTTALGLVKQGLHYLADDKVLLREEGDRIAACAVTPYFNIDPDLSRQCAELAGLEDLDPLPGCSKRPLDISAVYPGAFVQSCQPRFLIHLEVRPEGKSRLVRLSRSESFTRLVHQTILSAHKSVALKQLAVWGKLVRRTESYLLERGTDLYGVSPHLAQFLPC
jgi:hypothetical protein